MDNFLLLLAPALAATINAGTPLMLAAFGLLVNEKTGVLNLGAEGMMLVAAIAGFATTIHTGSVTLGFLAGAAAGMLAAAFFGLLVIWLGTNQYATGLALSIFGGGLSAFVGIPYTGRSLAAGKFAIPVLSDIPFLGPVLFRQHPMVYVALLLCAALAWFLMRTRTGLVLRAVGESPESAHALGYSVRRIRMAAVVFGGACCGLAGAYLALVYTPLWQEGMTAGKGWIALALTTFACWKPWRVLGGAYLFGGFTILQLNLQGLGIAVAPQFMAMLPYLATVVVLALISRNPDWIRLNIPASLGKNFNPAAV
ncbi:nucleoside ABC transporter membrane protein [Noviherbaspirillum humi]|uniref:Nucleoside ABC transporter membrane protein n=1 Tax=Noviherbaspirillum humi TaxID=1688639 RepID=A0A239HUR8_9BURK|nr:ABC transporter permease [Noviherbaspirillum humi]SNS85035.1 nucleoside ABC transporter membrane protein [Noviherbaspirillum humi]